MSAAAQVLPWILPRVYATAARARTVGAVIDVEARFGPSSVGRTLERAPEPERNRPRPVAVELAFYRKYTEAMLKRYVSMSLEAGRVPSLLGKEMFRGKVTHYEVHGFDDVVIFIHDMEACIKKLDDDQQWLIRRIALQEFTPEEAAGMLHLKRMTVTRRYGDAINRLTAILLEVRLLEPFVNSANSCQEGEA